MTGLAIGTTSEGSFGGSDSDALLGTDALDKKKDIFNLSDISDPEVFFDYEKKASNDIKKMESAIEHIKMEYKEWQKEEYMNLQHDDKAEDEAELQKKVRENWVKFQEVLQEHSKVWRDKVKPSAFVRNVRVLGEKVDKYFDLLTVRLDDWLVWELVWKKLLKYHRFQKNDSLFLDTVSKEDLEGKNEGDCINLSEIEQKGISEMSCWKHARYLRGISAEKHETHWTSLHQLINPKQKRHKVYVIKALYNCGSSSNCFNSVAARLILEKYWKDIQAGYFRKVLFNIFFLLALAANTSYIMYVGAYFGKDHDAPPLWMTRMTGVFSIISVVGPMADLLLHFYFMGWETGLLEYLTFWNLSTAAVEILVAGFLFPVLWLNDDRANCLVTGPDLVQKYHCSFAWHSVAYMAAIAVKWMHLTLELMCIEFFGKSVLPAFSAITGREARKFMAFLALVVAASFQAYWSLPIPENQPRPGFSHLWRIFTEVFKLDILGDYDVWDLEGVHDEFNRSGHGDMAEIDEGTESHLYHDGVSIMGTFLSCFVAVSAMNVSIGVLGKAYEENKARANQIYCHFKAGYTFKLLQRQVARKEFIDKVCGCCTEEANDDKKEEPLLRGHLIRFQPKSFIDQKPLEEESLEQLTRLKQIENRLDNDLRTIKHELGRLAGKELMSKSKSRIG